MMTDRPPCPAPPPHPTPLLCRYGIRCNTVVPGFIRSPMTDKVPRKVLDKVCDGGTGPRRETGEGGV